MGKVARQVVEQSGVDVNVLLESAAARATAPAADFSGSSEGR